MQHQPKPANSPLKDNPRASRRAGAHSLFSKAKFQGEYNPYLLRKISLFGNRDKNNSPFFKDKKDEELICARAIQEIRQGKLLCIDMNTKSNFRTTRFPQLTISTEQQESSIELSSITNPKTSKSVLPVKLKNMMTQSSKIQAAQLQKISEKDPFKKITTQISEDFENIRRKQNSLHSMIVYRSRQLSELPRSPFNSATSPLSKLTTPKNNYNTSNSIKSLRRVKARLKTEASPESNDASDHNNNNQQRVFPLSSALTKLRTQFSSSTSANKEVSRFKTEQDLEPIVEHKNVEARLHNNIYYLGNTKNKKLSKHKKRLLDAQIQILDKFPLKDLRDMLSKKFGQIIISMKD